MTAQLHTVVPQRGDRVASGFSVHLQTVHAYAELGNRNNCLYNVTMFQGQTNVCILPCLTRDNFILAPKVHFPVFLIHCLVNAVAMLKTVAFIHLCKIKYIFLFLMSLSWFCPFAILSTYSYATANTRWQI